MAANPPPERGPFRVDDLQPGDPYELSRGQLVYVAPTGGRGSGPNLIGGAAVAWDPAVAEAGVDTGYSLGPDAMRAPDVAIGNVPDVPGWVPGVPFLAIEYADVGQDERQLTRKIDELLAAGTKLIWVVRLTEPRRVEVFAPGADVRTAWPGDYLVAPGILKNPVLVEALYDRDAAQRATLNNLLQREGYESLEAVRAEARRQVERELAESHRNAIRDLCELFDLALSPEREAELAAMDAAGLSALRARLKRDRRWD